jgi:uncharacterized protein YrrD
VRSILQVTGKPVVNHSGRRVGRVSEVLFAPDSKRVAGYVVSRPRLLMILDRQDRYLAFDRSTLGEDEIAAEKGRASWDAAAARRLGFSWDVSVIWLGMPVLTRGGESLGKVRDALFDPKTGELEAVGLTEGVTADVALGFRDLPSAMVAGFDGKAVVVENEAATTGTSGGAAAAAGRGAAVAKQAAGEAARQVKSAAKTASAYGTSAVRVAARSKTARRTAGWLKALKDEVVDMMGDPDDE